MSSSELPDAAIFNAREARAERLVDLRSTLPEWPFRSSGGYVAFAHFDLLLDSTFDPVLKALAEAYGDDTVSLVTVDPTPNYYAVNYGYWPSIEVRGLEDNRFRRALEFEPGGDPAGALADTANTVAVFGTSGLWAIWGEREWHLAVVHVATVQGDWLNAGVRFFKADAAYEYFTAFYRQNYAPPDGLQRVRASLTEHHVSELESRPPV
jgi:hypothetical protein